MKATCLILTSDSHINKGNCLRHSLHSIIHQTYDDFEILISENSSQKQNIDELVEYYRNIVKQSKKRIEINILNLKEKLPRGQARNAGAAKAKGDILIFIDDDAILYTPTALQQVMDAALQYDYGYGAKRLWTNPLNWFPENADTILKSMEKGEDPFKDNIGAPPSIIRKDAGIELLQVAFISNFGFCKKELFNQVGGYPDFPGPDFEDDCLTYRCFKYNGNYIILNDISVLHVSHEMNLAEKSNISLYYDTLRKDGYFWFSIYDTFFNKGKSRDEILLKLKSIHPDYRVVAAYEEYLKQIPANLSSDRTFLKIWEKTNRYDPIDFSMLIKKLIESKNLNEFVKQSKADFDNLIPFINACVTTSLIKIDKNGAISNTFDFKYFPSYDIDIHYNVFDNPNESYNQFPCDLESRKRRLELLKERYPFTDFLRVGLLGDDDLTSTLLGQESWLETLVFEKDERITLLLQDKFPHVKIYDYDMRDKMISDIPPLHTFICDPPYTLDGALLFILRGLEAMGYDKSIREFYVILNETMMGTHLQLILKYLMEANIWLAETKSNFSTYELPVNFEEKARANKFLKNLHINSTCLQYSSSSNLYIFRTKEPNLQQLMNSINIDLIYQHFI